MNQKTDSAALSTMDLDAFDELIRRVEDIDNSYRAVAEKAGKLYMLADEHKLNGVTEALDKPMRNASDNEQAFSAMLSDLRMQRQTRKAPAVTPADGGE